MVKTQGLELAAAGNGDHRCPPTLPGPGRVRAGKDIERGLEEGSNEQTKDYKAGREQGTSTAPSRLHPPATSLSGAALG